MKKSLWIEFLSSLGGLFLILISILIGFGISNKISNEIPERECIMENSTLFDTAIIEAQGCINYDTDKGRIRFVHAWGYDEEQHLVEDETGNLWEILEDVIKDEAMLLWIADNNTPEDVTDDIIIRVWREA